MPGSELEATYREQLFEAIRRSHNLQPPRLLDTTAVQAMRRSTPESEPIRRMGVDFERVRRLSAEAESRMNPTPTYEWDRRLQETPVFSEAPPIKPASPHNSKASLIVSSAPGVDSSAACNLIKVECNRNDIEITSKELSEDVSEQRSTGNRSPNCIAAKSQASSTRIQEDTGTPMTEEERLSFLKSASKISASNPIAREGSAINNFHAIPGLFPHRSSPRDDMLYSPLNNNIFPFPSYPPVWPSILPFPSLAKFYPPFNTPPTSGVPISLDGLKNPVFLPADLRNAVLPSALPDANKEDSSNKKRILDAILQVQRESACGPRSPRGGLSPPGVTLAMSLPPHVTTCSSPLPLVTATTTTASATGEQPIDLTVRRKRKMAKRDIMYQPTEDQTCEAIDEPYEHEPKDQEGVKDEEMPKEDPTTEDERMEEVIKKEILVKGTSEIVDLKTGLECASSLPEPRFEVPLKIMKLETASEGLIT